MVLAGYAPTRRTANSQARKYRKAGYRGVVVKSTTKREYQVHFKGYPKKKKK